MVGRVVPSPEAASGLGSIVGRPDGVWGTASGAVEAQARGGEEPLGPHRQGPKPGRSPESGLFSESMCCLPREA